MAKDFLTIEDVDLRGKTVLMRVDLNSPINPATGKLLGDIRIREHAQSIKRMKGCRLVLIAHQSRPGKADFVSLNEHAKRLAHILRKPVHFIDDLFGSKARNAIMGLRIGEILLLENVRFYSEEVLVPVDKNTPDRSHIVKNLAPLVDMFVNDAFATSHRGQISMTGFADIMPMLAGPVMAHELNSLGKVLEDVEKPSVAVLGGLKVDDSIAVAKNMLEAGTVDTVLTTGVVANVFLVSHGYDLGKPNMEFMRTEIKDYDKVQEEADELLKKYPDAIKTPTDLAVNADGVRERVSLKDLPVDKPLFDIGLDTIIRYGMIIRDAKTVTANGPAGVFELKEFALGTNEIFRAIADAHAYSVLGGGETNAVIEAIGVKSQISHISTGGGACIRFLGGEALPAIEALRLSKKLYEKGAYNKRKKEEGHKVEVDDYTEIYDRPPEGTTRKEEKIYTPLYEMDEE